MSIAAFNLFLGVMSLTALIVFIALYFVKAGYGIFRTASWGVAISNKLAWILMEAPVFLVMCWMWMHSERRFDPVILTFFVFFQIHYFQRAFVFPLLLTGKSKMPLAIMSMGILFNLLNGYMQGEWIFYLSPEGMYHSGWFTSAAATAVFSCSSASVSRAACSRRTVSGRSSSSVARTSSAVAQASVAMAAG